MRNIGVLIFVIGFTIVSCENNTMKGKSTLENVQVINESDPVCGMSTKEHLKDTLTYEGKLYGFCNTKCKEEFKKNPQEFLKK